jgi:RNA polymerase sigma factor (sigma-70 family)
MDVPTPVPAELERLLHHREWLRGLAHRLVGEAAADDLVQETWLAAMRRPPDPSRPVRPWLAGVVRKLARMRARGEGRRARRQQEVARRDELPSTAELIEGVDTQRRLAQVVLELDEPYRTTLLLRYFHDLSAAEIARRQELPSGTVRWRLKRGLEEMRERLDREWGERREWCLALVALSDGGHTLAGAAVTGVAAASLWLRVAALAVLLALLGFSINGLWPDQGAIPAQAPAEPLLATAVESPVVASGPSAEARVAASEATLLAGVIFTLREQAGPALADQRAVLIDADGGVQVGTTDSLGRLRFQPAAGPGVLWFSRPGAFVQRREVALDPGDSELVLPTGGVYSGRVEVIGDRLGALTLDLDFDRLIYPAAVPTAVRAELGSCRRASAKVDSGGTFRFHGLPADWSGELWVPGDLIVTRLDGNPVPPLTHVHVTGAAEDARLELAWLPRIRGEITTAGEPAEDARVKLSLTFADGKRHSIEVEIDPEGRFDQRLQNTGLRLVELEARRGSDLARARRELEPQGPGAVLGSLLDLGSIALEPAAREVTVTVLDGSGEPIPGARGRAHPDGRVSANSDGLGLMLIGLGPDSSGVQVGGAGWRTRTLAVEEGVQELVARLAPAGRLSLDVVDPDGRALPGARLRLSAEGPLFGVDGPGGGLGAEDLAGTLRGSTLRATRYITDADGRVEFEGLVPGSAFEVEVLDSLARPFGRTSLVAPSGSERIARELVAEALPRTLAGVCTDPAGDVLVGVRVSLSGYVGRDGRARGGRPLEQRSDGDGTFSMTGIGPGPIVVELRKRGFAPVRLTDLLLVAGEAPRRFVMESGRDLVLRVEDENGLPLEGGRLTAHSDGINWLAEEVAPGVHRLQDLPGRSVELALEFAGTDFTPVDGRAPEQRFEVRDLAVLSVGWTLPQAAAGVRWRLVLAPTQGRGRPLAHHLPAGETSGLSRLGRVPAGGYELWLERGLADAREPRWTRALEPQMIQIEAQVSRHVTVDLAE